MTDHRDETENFLLEVGRGLARSVGDAGEVEFRPPDGNHGLEVVLTPKDDSRARLYFHAESAEQIDVRIGVGLRFELFYRDRRELEGSVTKLVSAVLAGAVEETVWLAGSEVIKAKGSIDIHGGRKRVRYRNSALETGGSRSKLTYRYEPYVTESTVN